MVDTQMNGAAEPQSQQYQPYGYPQIVYVPMPQGYAPQPGYGKPEVRTHPAMVVISTLIVVAIIGLVGYWGYHHVSLVDLTAPTSVAVSGLPSSGMSGLPVSGGAGAGSVPAVAQAPSAVPAPVAAPQVVPAAKSIQLPAQAQPVQQPTAVPLPTVTIPTAVVAPDAAQAGNPAPLSDEARLAALQANLEQCGAACIVPTAVPEPTLRPLDPVPAQPLPTKGYEVQFVGDNTHVIEHLIDGRTAEVVIAGRHITPDEAAQIDREVVAGKRTVKFL